MQYSPAAASADDFPLELHLHLAAGDHASSYNPSNTSSSPPLHCAAAVVSSPPSTSSSELHFSRLSTSPSRLTRRSPDSIAIPAVGSAIRQNRRRPSSAPSPSSLLSSSTAKRPIASLDCSVCPSLLSERLRRAPPPPLLPANAFHSTASTTWPSGPPHVPARPATSAAPLIAPVPAPQRILRRSPRSAELPRRIGQSCQPQDDDFAHALRTRGFVSRSGPRSGSTSDGGRARSRRSSQGVRRSAVVGEGQIVGRRREGCRGAEIAGGITGVLRDYMIALGGHPRRRRSPLALGFSPGGVSSRVRTPPPSRRSPTRGESMPPKLSKNQNRKQNAISPAAASADDFPLESTSISPPVTHAFLVQPQQSSSSPP
ncbi:uncharacterized protein A4U43_C10F3130 [Asparagus officinalis]|uniref:Uncharacterized protein n=1 Tax=Asparagus officinalis TaxID=4686 RepID=A0A5P1E0C5_ASPOF|nr:uncharacterized protein A4U43_C10F3130 [Asparagus officinalis]